MKKRLLAIVAVIVAVMVAVVGASLLTLAMLPAGPGVTKANFEQINEGMTAAEVEAVFGGAGRESILLGVNAKNGRTERLPADPHAQSWEGREGFAAIQFNENGRVVDRIWTDAPSSFWQKLQRWLPWLPD